MGGAVTIAVDRDDWTAALGDALTGARLIDDDGEEGCKGGTPATAAPRWGKHGAGVAPPIPGSDDDDDDDGEDEDEDDVEHEQRDDATRGRDDDDGDGVIIASDRESEIAPHVDIGKDDNVTAASTIASISLVTRSDVTNNRVDQRRANDHEWIWKSCSVPTKCSDKREEKELHQKRNIDACLLSVYCSAPSPMIDNIVVSYHKEYALGRIEIDIDNLDQAQW